MKSVEKQLKKTLYWLPKTNWNNQRAFLDEISVKFAIRNPSDWGKITKNQVKKEGGAVLLNKYNDSLFSALKNIYTEINWQNDWFVNRKTKKQQFWKDTLNQRKFFFELSQKLNITKPHHWGKVTSEQIIKNGGSGILVKYRYSLYDALVSLFPETPWEENWFRLRRGVEYWEVKENRRNFLEELAKKYQLKNIRELSTLSKYHIAENGGNKLLQMHKGSIKSILKSTFPELEWKDEWFSHNYVSHGYWDNPKNARNFLEKVAKENEVKTPQDWGNVKISQVTAFGGYRLLFKHGNSLLKTLRAVFPGIKRFLINCSETQWKKEWFHAISVRNTGYWKDQRNQRKFFDDLAKTLKISKPEHWGKISAKKISEYGGIGLLKYYKGSLIQCLKTIYPEITWKGNWFQNTQHKRDYWNSVQNQRNFLSAVAEAYSIKNWNDWRRISPTLLRSQGGKGLLSKYKESVSEMLIGVFPEFKIHARKRSTKGEESVLRAFL